MIRPSEQSKDLRLKVTSKIWAFATGMLAICIPLSAATKSGAIIPIAVIAGAAIGTTSVWRGDRKSSNRIEDSYKIEKLEGRIADLEAILTTQDIDFQRRIESTAKSNSSILPKSF
ncbi:hypothetical protein HC931_00430 [Candidatus Gracilibacteria bacterium]|nr:hypothetical protein [Candidatus Gracilibacteria bacterium]NJM85956.1 hypothetical protein [Hydrococcus sp. RU_2_2]NJP17612.1 hypothetical protein [Hydrococcus sp. CRU_1_1]